MSTPTILIVGGGSSGICAGIKLKEIGVETFTIVERSSGLGGTWYNAKYPGLCCDVASAAYQYSFEQNPEWSSDYPGQEELLKYVSKVASKYAIPEKAVLNTNVEEIRWNDDKQKWVATLKNLAAKAGEEAVTTLETDFVISAIGVLTDTSTCGIKGSMDGTFKGKEVHTGKWDDAWDWTGKRVAVIGCAASGIQVIPQIAAKAAQTIIYHRTPNHILPRENNKYSAEQIAEFKSNPAKYAEHRKATMAKFTFVTAALLDPEGDAQKFMRGVCQQHLEALIPESQKRMRSLLTPDFPFGCRRFLVSDNFYQALVQPNVEIVTEPVVCIGASGVVSDPAKDPHAPSKYGEADTFSGKTHDDGSREREVDAIVYATGYVTGREPLYPIFGRNGISLKDRYHSTSGPEAYLGGFVDGFPNLFLATGPSSIPAHSFILGAEINLSYFIYKVLPVMMEKGLATIEVKREAVDEYVDNFVMPRLNKSTLNIACPSYYKYYFDNDVHTRLQAPNKDYKITPFFPGFIDELPDLRKTVEWDKFEVKERKEGKWAMPKGPRDMNVQEILAA